MYSYEERMKAVRLYIQYDLSVVDTIRGLGFSSGNLQYVTNIMFENKR